MVALESNIKDIIGITPPIVRCATLTLGGFLFFITNKVARKMKKNLNESQELYLTMVQSTDAAKIDALKIRKDTKRNIKLVYGFLSKVGIKGCNYTKLQNTGRQANVYRVGSKSWDKLIIASYATISSQVGISHNSVGICIQHLVNLKLIEIVDNEVGMNSTSSWDSNTNTNTITNTITNSNSFNLDLYYKSLIEEQQKTITNMTEVIKDLQTKVSENEQLISELACKNSKLEEAVMSLIEEVDELKNKINTTGVVEVEEEKHTCIPNSNSYQRTKFWKSFTNFKASITSGKVTSQSEIDKYYQVYVEKAKHLYNGDVLSDVLQKMESQFNQIVKKKTTSTSDTFQVRECDKVYYQGEAGNKNHLALCVQDMLYKRKAAPIANDYAYNLSNFYINILIAKSGFKPEEVYSVWDYYYDRIVKTA